MNSASLPAAIVAAYPADCRPVQASRIADGFSDSWIWRCQAPRGELAVRAWPPEQSAARIAWIHRFQLHLAATCPIAVPAPVATQRGDTRIAHGERIWEMANWLPGEPRPAHAFSPEQRAAVCQALAQLHSAAASFESGEARSGPAPAAQRRLADLQRLVQTNRAAWPGLLDAAGWPALAPLASDWNRLAERMLPIVERELTNAVGWTVPLQACLRDMRSDHVLFLGPRVSGIIDFGAAGWDSVACDLARLAPSLAGDDPSALQPALADYESVRPLNPAERELITILDRAASLLGPALWFRWVAEEHRDFRDPPRIIERVAGLLARLARQTW